MRKRVTLLLLLVLSALALATTAGAATPVTKAQREVLVVSPGLAQGSAVERAFYDFVEFNAVALATTTLGARYAAVNLLRGSAATPAGFLAELDRIASKPGVRAVDMIFLTHGLTNEVSLHGRDVTVAELGAGIRLRLTAAERAKLRMVFSTACFGASHLTAWRNAGFRAASGSRGVYADSAASYLPFLSAWAVGASFGASVTAANVAGASSSWDAAAKPWLVAHGRPELAAQVNSWRVTSGSTSLTIGTMP